VDASVDTGPLPLSGLEVSAGALDVFGRRLNELRVGASRSGNDWQLDLRGRELEGMARWEHAAPAHPNGRIVARLQRLTPPTAASSHAAPTATSPSEVNSWPEIDLTAETLRLKERDLGRLDPEAIALVRSEAWPIVRDAEELHDTLLTVGALPERTWKPVLTWRIMHIPGALRAAGCGPRRRDADPRPGFVEGRAAGLRLPDAQRQASPRNRARPVHQARSRSR
jgi:hypothetical protein